MEDLENINTTLEASKQHSRISVVHDASPTPLKDISNDPILNLDAVNDSIRDLSKLGNFECKQNWNPLDDTCPTIVRKRLQTPLISKKNSTHDLRVGKSSTSFKNLSISDKNPLDVSCPTIVTRHLQTPLMEKMKKDVKNNVSSSSLDRTLTNDNSARKGTPRKSRQLAKLSDTFITNLMPENCLISTSIIEEESFLKNNNTPEMFKNKQNDNWPKEGESCSNVSSSVDVSFKSRLPHLKRTPNKKYFPPKSPFAAKINPRFQSTQSPVAEYIYKGKSVQSMSKPRHSSCLRNEEQKSISENKIKPCKIPTREGNAIAKRKLVLGEYKLEGKIFHAVT